MNQNVSGSMEGEQEPSELVNWITHNKFSSKLKKKILESDEEIDLDLLKICNQDTINELCKELNLTGLQKIKFISSVKLIPDSVLANTNTTNKIVTVNKTASNAIEKIKNEIQNVEKYTKNIKSTSQS